MTFSVGKRLTSSWLAGVAVAAAVLVPLRLGVLERIFTTPDLRQALADYLLTSGIGYFIGVFVSLPVLILAGIMVRLNRVRVANAVGLWSASGALILACGATLSLHLTPVAHKLSSELALRLNVFDTLGFFLICFGVSALAYQLHEDDPAAKRDTAGSEAKAAPETPVQTQANRPAQALNRAGKQPAPRPARPAPAGPGGLAEPA